MGSDIEGTFTGGQEDSGKTELYRTGEGAEEGRWSGVWATACGLSQPGPGPTPIMTCSVEGT